MPGFIVRDSSGRVRIYRDPSTAIVLFGIAVAVEVIVLLLAYHHGDIRDRVAFSGLLVATLIGGGFVLNDHLRRPITTITADGLLLRQPEEFVPWTEIAELRIARDELYVVRRDPSDAAEGRDSKLMKAIKRLPPRARLAVGALGVVAVVGAALVAGDLLPLWPARSTRGARTRPVDTADAKADHVAGIIATFAPHVPQLCVLRAG